MTDHKLPDLLAPKLRVIFVGTAAGKYSAKVGAYYAKPGNQFWAALHEARTEIRMLLGLIFLLIVGGGSLALDAKLRSRRRIKSI